MQPFINLPVSRVARAATSFVAVHGITDIDQNWLPVYLTSFLVPQFIVFPLFLVSSVAHFAIDIGAAGSVSFHLAVGIIDLFDRKTSVNLMGIYLVFHSASHYVRCIRRGRIRGVVLAVAGTLASVFLGDSSTNVSFSLTHFIQRLVTAHTIVEGRVVPPQSK